MDKSELYIKMCDCPEIQALRPMNERWELGDYLSEGYIRWTVADGSMRKCVSDIWLPRQDQLQEMIKPDFKGMYYKGKADDYAVYVLDVLSYNDLTDFESMEQLWLAFVMKERFNKVWDGEKWIKL